MVIEAGTILLLATVKAERTRNKSNASFEAVQYRQDVFPIAL